MKKNTLHKLKRYIAGAGATLAAGISSNAAIVHTTVNYGGGFETYDIDIDGDTNDDISFTATDFFGSYSQTCVPLGGRIAGNALGTASNGFLSNTSGSDGYLNISSGVSISSAAGGFNNSLGNGGVYSFSCSSTFTYRTFGNFGSLPSDKIFGVRFDISGNTHFGWVRINIQQDASWTLIDMAYETCTNTAIIAGATTGGGGAVGTGTFSTNPTDITACEGDDVFLTAVFSGTGTTFDWELSSDGGASWSSASNSTDTIGGIVSSTEDGLMVRRVAFDCGGIYDSTSAATLTVNSVASTSQTIMECNSITINGNTYTSSQTVIDTLTGANTCDSIVTTNLTIGYDSYASTDIITCGTSYNWSVNGMTYSTSGNYIDTTTNGTGCSDFTTLNLTFSTYAQASIDVSGCDSALAFGNYYSSSQIVFDTIANGSVNNCDSITLANVTVNMPSTSSETIIDCLPVNINGNIYSASQMVVDTLAGVSALGCDSIHTTDLTIGTFKQVNYDYVGCDSVSAFGTMYYSTQIVNDTAIAGALNGCDSITVTNVTVNNSSTTSNSATILEGESIMLGGALQTTAGTYVDSYMTAEGCDSIITTVLNVTPDGIMYGDKLNIKVYPNPSTGLFSLDLSGMKSEQVDYIITDNTGRIVKSEVNVLSSDVKNIDLSSAGDGVYFLQVRSEDVSTIIKLVKN